jgi:putative SOS response-associated peptidase YedK
VCGRFNIISAPLTQFVMTILEGDHSVDPFLSQGQNDPSLLSLHLETRYNLAPTDQVPVLLRTAEGSWDIRDMRWWLVPYWSKGPDSKYSMFNARSETLTTSRAFKQPFRSRRCIVPASGYYEWVKEAGAKQPYYVEPVNAEGLVFAAIWETWQGESSVIESCSIVTTAATEGLASLHHRVPVMLSSEEVNAWVNPESNADILAEILAPAHKFPLSITPVTTHVNNARHKDQSCLETIGDPVIVN